MEHHNLWNEYENGNFQLMDHSIIFIQICRKFPFYTKWAEIKPILGTSIFYVPKMEVCRWNQPFCNFSKINQKLSKEANLKFAKWVKLKSTSLKSCKWMLLFFEPTVVAKTNVTVLQSPSSFIQCWSMNDWRSERLNFSLLCNIELGIKRTIRI